MIPIQTEVVNSFIRTQIDLERYSVGVADQVQKILTGAQDEILKALMDNDPTTKPLTEWKRRRLEDLNKQIDGILKNTFGTVEKTVNKALVGIAGHQNDAAQAQVKRVFGANLFNVTLTTENLQSIVSNTLIEGQTIGQWWQAKPEAYRQKFQQAMQSGMQQIELGLVKGESVGELIRRIRGTKDTPGVMDVAKHEAAALVRTSVMQVAQSVRRDLYDANADVLKGLQVVATLDMRTTPLCRGLDGTQYNLDGSPMNGGRPLPPGPPFHWNCRSTLVPIFKPYSELTKGAGKLKGDKLDELEKMTQGTRASMNGQVPEALNYNEWLKTQPEAIQQEILGESRWQLWKTDKITMADMVHQNGRPLTLAELEQKVALYDKKKEIELLVKELQAKIADPKLAVEFRPGDKQLNNIYEPIKEAKDLQEEYVDLKLDPVVAKEGKKISSGAIVFEPETGKVWIYEPKDHFEGYVHTFPKGTVQGAQALEKTAIREIWEETGLQTRLIGHLGDYEKSASVTRYFIGIRTGGSPAMAGWEAQGVKLVPQDQLSKYLNTAIDQKIAGDFTAAYEKAVYLGEGNALKGFEAISDELYESNLWTKKIADLIDAYPKLHAEIIESVIKTPGAEALKPAQKYQLIESAMKTKAAGDVNSWLLDPNFAALVPKTAAKAPLEAWEGFKSVADGFFSKAAKELKAGWAAPETALGNALKTYKQVNPLFEDMPAHVQLAQAKALAQQMVDNAETIMAGIEKGPASVRKHLLEWANSAEASNWKDSWQKAQFVEKMAKQAEADMLEVISANNPNATAAILKRDAAAAMDDYVEHLSQLEAGETMDVQTWFSLNEDVKELMFDDVLAGFGSNNVQNKILQEMEKDSWLQGTTWQNKINWLEQNGKKVEKAAEEYLKLVEKPGVMTSVEELMAADEAFLGKPLEEQLAQVKAKVDAWKTAQVKAAADADLTAKQAADMMAGDAKVKLGAKTFDLTDPAQLKEFKQKQNSAIQSYKAAIVQGKTPNQTMLDAVASLSPEKKNTLEAQIKAKMGGKMPAQPELHVAAEETSGGAISTTEKAAMDSLQEAATLHDEEWLEFHQALQDDADKMQAYMGSSTGENLKQFRAALQKKYNALIQENPDAWKAYMKTKPDLKAPVEYQFAEFKKQVAGEITEKANQAAMVEMEALKGKNPQALFDYMDSIGMDAYAEKPYTEKLASFKAYLSGVEAAQAAATEAAAVATETTLTGTVKFGPYTFDLSNPEQLKQFKQKQNSQIQYYKKAVLAGKKPSVMSQEAVDLLSPDKKELLKLQIEKKSGQMAAPQAIAQEVKPVTGDAIDFTKYKKYAPQKGSNEGGFYQNVNNPADRYYIKVPANEDIARNEILAGKLYQAAGVEVPELKFTTVDGRTSVASRIMDGVKADPDALQSGAIRAGVHDNFVVDAWLGDWDVVGQGYDNLLIKDGSRGVRIDVGGSLRYRAQGGAKGAAFGDEVAEIASMRNAADNPQAASVFQNITHEELLSGARKVLAVSDEDIAALVQKYGPTDPKERKALADTLIARKKSIARQFPELDVKAVAPAPPDAKAIITDMDHKQIVNARANGYSVPLDKESIEDHNVLFWHEKTTQSKQVTMASFKIRGKALEDIEKLIRKTGTATTTEVYSTSTLHDSMITAIKGMKKQMSGVADGVLRDTDIIRAKEALNKYKAIDADISSLIKAGKLGDNDLRRFRAHYKEWADLMEDASKMKAGSKFPKMKKYMEQKLNPLPDMSYKSKQATAAAGPKVKFTKVSGALEEKEIQNGHIRKTGRTLSVSRSDVEKCYEAEVNGVRVRYWLGDQSFAQKGKMELMATGADKASTGKILEAMKSLGLDTSRDLLNDEAMYLRQILNHMKALDVDLEMQLARLEPGEQVAKLKAAIKQQTGKDVTKMKGYAPQGTRSAFDNGYTVRWRPDLAEDKAFQDFRKEYVMYHSLYDNTPEAIDAILNSGGNLISTTNKLRVGMQWGGQSPGPDMGSGGADYLFTRIKKAREAALQRGLEWDADLLRRVDSISYNRDLYGRTTGDTVRTYRKSGVSEWKAAAQESGNETIFKNQLSILDSHLKAIRCYNESERRQVIAVFKKHGYKKFPDGRRLEDVIILCRT